MDAIEKKFIPQLDSPVESVQRMVLSQLQTHHEDTGRSWRGMVAEGEVLEKTVAQQTADIAALSRHNAQLQAANERWRKMFVSWEAAARQVRRLRECIAFNRGRVLAGTSVLACAAVGFNFFGPQTWPAAVVEREAVDKDLGRFGTEAWAEGESEPRIYRVGNKPYWVILRGDSETETHANDKGQAVLLQCVHIYAKPAEADYGVYIKPVSRSGFGWFSWPERVKLCKSPGNSAPMRRG
jgi:hypothetical protein